MFRKLLAKQCAFPQVELVTFCLMGNHFVLPQGPTGGRAPGFRDLRPEGSAFGAHAKQVPGSVPGQTPSRRRGGCQRAFRATPAPG
jgi:hypothetical protein